MSTNSNDFQILKVVLYLENEFWILKKKFLWEYRRLHWWSRCMTVTVQHILEEDTRSYITILRITWRFPIISLQRQNDLVNSYVTWNTLLVIKTLLLKVSENSFYELIFLFAKPDFKEILHYQSFLSISKDSNIFWIRKYILRKC